MKENYLKTKSYIFSLEIIKISLEIQNKNKDYVLSKQLLRSGTSIGANIMEAQGCQSRRDFLSKISIAYKEALETTYWLSLIKDIGFIDVERFSHLNSKCNELTRLLGSTKRTLIKNLK